MDDIINNRYQVVRRLGQGGMGETFLAKDSHLPSERLCVIKYLQPQTSDPDTLQLIQERFQREAAILEDLGKGCSQIPNLYAYFPHEESYCLVQEWIEGEDIQKTVANQGTLSEATVQSILESLLNTLDYVHSKGIIHRDIKPENVMLPQGGGKPVLIDFGAVRELMGTELNSRGVSAQSIAIGTPGFMPPEQAAGRPTYSSDLYSLGLTCIYMLTGRVPQALDSDPRTGEFHWRQYAPHVSPSLAKLLDQAIAPEQSRRFQSAQDMLRTLQSGTPLNNIPSPSNGTVLDVGRQPIQSRDDLSRGDLWFKAIIIGAIVGGSILWGVFLFTRSPGSTPAVDLVNTSPSPSTIPAPEPISTPTLEPTSTPTPEPSPSPEPPTPEPEPSPSPEPSSPEPEPSPSPEPSSLEPEPSPEPTETFEVSQQFPMQECGDPNPSGSQRFYPVYVYRRDLETLEYLQKNYCGDTFFKETLNVIQVASFQDPKKAEEFAKILKSDSNLSSGEVGWSTLR